ncbi:unnamed protein product [Soboliphyme baturini]|uniref:Glutamine-dependent NAD(+) synthetase n=1 Tax=Soboliphyme baturini TaxID=241478 RepID=A0A183ID63_9BILA|nr:unnamed protein product [Soboliphyme baturini]
MVITKVGVCSLNQWAMDFEGNRVRILKSMSDQDMFCFSAENGARIRVGSELEVCGYGCKSHFLEADTYFHAWQVVASIMCSDFCEGMLVVIGMHILLIRPSRFISNSRGYTEHQWFSTWNRPGETEEFFLPDFIEQHSVPLFGDAVLCFKDVSVAFQTGSEFLHPEGSYLWSDSSSADIFCVSAAVPHYLSGYEHLTNTVVHGYPGRYGGVLLFSNQLGCDGDQDYFDGGSIIVVNNNVVSSTDRFSMADLISVMLFSVSSSFRLGSASWLWQYLRRSGHNGFFLPLSGGKDSSAVACIVSTLCGLLCQAVNLGESDVLNDIRRIVDDPSYSPQDARELCNRLFVTCYLATENSSSISQANSSALAADIGRGLASYLVGCPNYLVRLENGKNRGCGSTARSVERIIGKFYHSIFSHHLNININSAVKAVLDIFTGAFNKLPRFRCHGGESRENLALQNVQARLRMVITYLFAQLTLWAQSRSGSLLVLGSANCDESLLGYMTKYDCSSADVNPIGYFSKKQLTSYLQFCEIKYEYESLKRIIETPPTAELEPLSGGSLVQTDEVEDMGITYDELSALSVYRRPGFYGPYSTFCKFLAASQGKASPSQVAVKVKHFYRRYAINRHKMTVVTPSYRATLLCPDDSRPFLYNVQWPWQFRQIDDKVGGANQRKHQYFLCLLQVKQLKDSFQL